MSNEIELLVALGIDTSGSTTKNIQSQIDELGKSLKGLDIKIDLPQDAIKALTELSKVDLKGLNDSLKTAKDGLGGVGEEAKQVGIDTKKAFEQAQKTIDQTLGHLGQDFQKEIKKGITSIDDLKAAFKGMDASFKFDKSNLGIDEDGRQAEAVRKVTVEYKNLQGQIEKTQFALSNHRVAIGREGDTKQIFLPSDTSKVVDSQMRQVENSVAKARDELHKLGVTGKLSSEQIKDLSKYLDKIDNTAGITQYNKKLTENISNNKQLTKEKKEQLAVEEKIRKLQNSIVSSQGRDPKGMGNSPEVKGMLDSLQKINPASKGAANAVKGVSDSFDVMKAKSVEAGRSSLTVMESFKTAMEKFPIYIHVGVKLFELLETPETVLATT